MFMNSPLISVIIPTYNRAAFIKDAIESVLNQTYKNYEIIVVDDGSIDNTKEIVSSIAGSIRYIYKSNSGPSASRNRGIREARGEYIAFLDSDDLWDPEKLELQMNEFLGNPELAMVTSNYRFIDQNKQVIKDPVGKEGYVPPRYIIADMVRLQFPWGGTSQFIFRRSVFEDVGVFNERLRISEDLDLLIRIGVRYPIAYVNRVLTSIRLHENHSMRETPRADVWLSSVKVYESHIAEIRKIVPNPERFFANFYSLAARSALLAFKRVKSLKLSWEVVLRNPWSLRGYKDCLRCFFPAFILKKAYERSSQSKVHELLKKYQ